MNLRGSTALGICLMVAMVPRSAAVILLASGDPLYHTTTPGDNSGWQYQGNFRGCLGTPIAPHFFLTAKHIGDSTPGDVFDFHGDSYTTIVCYDSPSTDLRIWKVTAAKPFPTYAPLSSGAADLGTTATICGRGTQRGAEIVVAGQSKGWGWGYQDGVERWGRNTAVTVLTSPPLLKCDFDNPGIADECHASIGDSGGGMFVMENGLWRLAGITYSVDGPFRTGPSDPGFWAALYDEGGLDNSNGTTWTSVPEQTANIPSSFYSSRVAASLSWIAATIAPESNALPAQSYGAWQSLYFTPAQIATPATTGPMADFDGDGIGNLLEFALNLDPTFNGQVNMLSNTGVSGLPAVRLETTGGSTRLTIEFVRRTSTSGSGLTYIPEFSSDLMIWQAGGTATVTAINPRWERVKITDSLTTAATPRRFARLRVTLAP